MNLHRVTFEEIRDEIRSSCAFQWWWSTKNNRDDLLGDKSRFCFLFDLRRKKQYSLLVSFICRSVRLPLDRSKSDKGFFFFFVLFIRESSMSLFIYLFVYFSFESTKMEKFLRLNWICKWKTIVFILISKFCWMMDESSSITTGLFVCSLTINSEEEEEERKISCLHFSAVRSSVIGCLFCHRKQWCSFVIIPPRLVVLSSLSLVRCYGWRWRKPISSFSLSLFRLVKKEKRRTIQLFIFERMDVLLLLLSM